MRGSGQERKGRERMVDNVELKLNNDIKIYINWTRLRCDIFSKIIKNWKLTKLYGERDELWNKLFLVIKLTLKDIQLVHLCASIHLYNINIHKTHVPTYI